MSWTCSPSPTRLSEHWCHFVRISLSLLASLFRQFCYNSLMCYLIILLYNERKSWKFWWNCWLRIKDYLLQIMTFSTSCCLKNRKIQPKFLTIRIQHLQLRKAGGQDSLELATQIKRKCQTWMPQPICASSVWINISAWLKLLQKDQPNLFLCEYNFENNKWINW